jgi:predicted ATP-dependent endonuclease of OLD family
MKIRKVEIKNWRSIKHVEIDFQNLMIFIGQNNHGKSNIISALLFFFGQINPDDLDYYKEEKELYVEVTFGELNDVEKNTFSKYVTSENAIRVRKIISKESASVYNGYIEQPDLDWLKEEKISNYTNRDIASTLPLYDLLPSSGRIRLEDFKNAQLEFIGTNRKSIKFTYSLESSPFMGAKNVAKGIFGEVFYIPPVKSAKEDLSTKGNSVFGQLYSRVIARMSEQNKEFIDAKNKMIQLVSILNKKTEDGKANKQRPSELTSLETLLDMELKRWNTKIDVEITPPNVDDIFKVGADIWIDDGIRTDIERKGHGLQRAFIFALLKVLSVVIKEEAEKKETELTDGERKKLGRISSNTNYFFFEEPELYLHPQAQRESFSALVDLSKSENQVMLCTHSSSFIDLNYHKSICIVKKENIDDGTSILQYTEDLFTKDEEKKQFDMTYWINPDRGELFFANKIILVEGTTEKTVIPLLAQKLGVFRYDYTLIDCGSKDAMPAYIKLLNKFSLQYLAVYDIDNQSIKTSAQKQEAARKSKLIEDVINKKYGNSIKFANDIEEELGLISANKSGKPYQALKFILEESFVLKEGLKKKIKLIFG